MALSVKNLKAGYGGAVAIRNLTTTIPEGVCGGGKAARYLDARCRELADQLTQRGILAAHDLDIGPAKLYYLRNLTGKAARIRERR